MFDAVRFILNSKQAEEFFESDFALTPGGERRGVYKTQADGRKHTISKMLNRKK